MVVKRPMVAFLTQLLLAIRSRFTRRARLEAENLLLRQQLVVLRRKLPTPVRPAVPEADLTNRQTEVCDTTRASVDLAFALSLVQR